MAKSVADVLKMVKEDECKFVDFRFTDTRGKEQHVSARWADSSQLSANALLFCIGPGACCAGPCWRSCC